MIDPNKADMGYKDGYTNGYNYLAQDRWNFLHPNGSYTYPDGHTIYGYIPGGPYVFTARSTDAEKWKAVARMSKKYHDDWLLGWVDGINKYVEDNKLDYPKVEHHR